MCRDYIRCDSCGKKIKSVKQKITLDNSSVEERQKEYFCRECLRFKIDGRMDLQNEDPKSKYKW